MCSLPRRFLHPRDLAFVRQFTEADATKIEVTHVAMATTTLETATHDARAEFWFAFCANFY